MEYILLIVGFVLLIKGADFFVDGSSSVAKIMHIPSIIIGLTVVAFGTSMPELSVSVSAALHKANELAVGNVVGSNIFNCLMVLGVSAIIVPVVTNQEVMKKEFPFSIVIAIALFVFMGGYQIQKLTAIDSAFVLTRIAGTVLLVLFVGFVYSSVRDALKARNAHNTEDEEQIDDTEEHKILTPIKTGLYIIGGLAGIVIGGDLVVDSASIIGATFGMSENLIGLSIVAIGTSLPELVTSAVAAIKGQSDLALGNVVGSNVFNILLILGVSAVITPIQVTTYAMYDVIILLVVSIVTFIFAKTGGKITRAEGAILVLGYITFFIYILNR